MKILIFAAVLLSVSFATADSTRYFQGKFTSTMLEVIGAPSSENDLILKKTQRPDQIVEIATLLMPIFKNGTMVTEVIDSTVIMDIVGSDAKVSTPEGTIVGHGIVQGEPGDWSFFELYMTFVPNGMKIRDVNYMNSNKIIARKEMYSDSGKPFMLWEAEVLEISEKEYLDSYARMHSLK